MRCPTLLLMLVSSSLAASCGLVEAEWRQQREVSEAAVPRFETVVRVPPALDGLPTDTLDPLGRPVVVACATCHDGRAVTHRASSDVPVEFHVGLDLQHGELTCMSCHAERDRDRLVLAGGPTISMDDAVELCGQCHGPQRRDYEHRSHGGLAGYWDTTRGPRTRNHCIMCHDPHEPAFPAMMPMPPPRDRFLAPGAAPHGREQ